METVFESEIISSSGFPTATPVLDVLRASPSAGTQRLTTGDYFFVSSAVMVAFTQLPYIQSIVDFISRQPLAVFWGSLLGLPLAAFFLAMAIHETGHLIAARMTGFAAVRIKFGPFTFREKLEANDVLSLGYTVLRPQSSEGLRWRTAVVVSAGPLASFLFPVLLEGALHLLPGRWTTMMVLAAGVHLCSVVSFLMGVGSLLPDIDATGNFSDGTRLLMLLKNDFRASRLLAILELQLGLNSGQHPRTWGEDLVARAVNPTDESFDFVGANWLAYQWADARQDLTQATGYLEQALSGLASSPGHLRDRILLEAAIYQAWYRHNLVKARLWTSQIGKPNALSPLEHMRLEIACCWAEGKSFDAWEMLQKYLQRVRDLPTSTLRTSAERDALEWKAQMESRMLAGAWATMHSWPYERQTQRTQLLAVSS